MSAVEIWTIALTAGTLGVTLVTVVFVILAELRNSRQYFRVDFEIDYIGPVNDGAYELFELTNCGTETATRITMQFVGCLPASSENLRRVVTLKTSESKRFVVELFEPIGECWVEFSYFNSSDRRYVQFTWEPLINLGAAYSDWAACRTRNFGERIVDRFRARFKIVTVVGRGHSPGTSVRAFRGARTEKGQERAAKLPNRWLSEQAQADPTGGK